MKHQVGELIEINNDTYGTYFMRCIALIDLINGNPLAEEKPNVDDVMFWLENYHPKHYFRTYSVKGSITPWSMYIYIALDVDNKDWLANNKTCHYVQDVGYKNAKSLPISIDDKKLESWFEKTEPYIVEKMNS
jgi:hypothetical protein